MAHDDHRDPARAARRRGLRWTADGDHHRRNARLHDRHRSPDRSLRRLPCAPGTSTELAERAGLHERYVREWLGAMVTSGIADYEPHTAVVPAAAGAHGVPRRPHGDEHGAVQPAQHPPRQARRAGGDRLPRGRRRPVRGVPPEFTDVMDAMGRGAYDSLLIDALRAARAGPHRPPARWRESRRRGLRHRPRPRAAGGRLPGFDVHRLRLRRRRHRPGSGRGRRQRGCPT